MVSQRTKAKAIAATPDHRGPATLGVAMLIMGLIILASLIASRVTGLTG